MTKAEREAVKEVLDAYHEPDSPEALSCAMYYLKQIYNRGLNHARPYRYDSRRIQTGPESAGPLSEQDVP